MLDILLIERKDGYFECPCRKHKFTYPNKLQQHAKSSQCDFQPFCSNLTTAYSSNIAANTSNLAIAVGTSIENFGASEVDSSTVVDNFGVGYLGNTMDNNGLSIFGDTVDNNNDNNMTDSVNAAELRDNETEYLEDGIICIN